MMQNNQNIYFKSIILIICIVILSCILHILLLVILEYTLSSYTKKQSSFVNIQKNDNVITLLPLIVLENNQKVLNKNLLKIKNDSVLKHKQSSTSVVCNKTEIIKKNNNTPNVDYHNSNIGMSSTDCNQNTHSFNTPIVVNGMDHVSNPIKRLKFPCIIKRVYPDYPNQAQALNIEGFVKVMYNVNCLGKIEKMRVLSAVPIGVFEENVKFSMRRWVYERNNSKKNLVVTFKFSLNKVQLID